MISINRLPISLDSHRFTISCSTPHNSGNSDSITRPPKPTVRSATCPIHGFAEIPENPSEAPHSIPRHNLERGAAVRPVLLISAKFSNVCRIAFSSISRSDGYFCCSNTKNGLSKFAHLLEISSSIMET